jgi:trigger factor
VSEVVRGKALALIVESATVTDTSGNHVELKLLRPDGTIGEPVDEVEETSEESSEAEDAAPEENAEEKAEA